MMFLLFCGSLLDLFASLFFLFFFFNDTATTEIYTLSLHDALPISLNSLRESDSVRRACTTSSSGHGSASFSSGFFFDGGAGAFCATGDEVAIHTTIRTTSVEARRTRMGVLLNWGARL